jgi:hypothetical protein
MNLKVARSKVLVRHHPERRIWPGRPLFQIFNKPNSGIIAPPTWLQLPKLNVEPSGTARATRVVPMPASAADIFDHDRLTERGLHVPAKRAPA